MKKHRSALNHAPNECHFDQSNLRKALIKINYQYFGSSVDSVTVIKFAHQLYYTHFIDCRLQNIIYLHSSLYKFPKRSQKSMRSYRTQSEKRQIDPI